MKRLALNWISPLRMTFWYLAFQPSLSLIGLKITGNWALEVLYDHCERKTVILPIVQEHWILFREYLHELDRFASHRFHPIFLEMMIYVYGDWKWFISVLIKDFHGCCFQNVLPHTIQLDYFEYDKIKHGVMDIQFHLSACKNVTLHLSIPWDWLAYIYWHYSLVRDQPKLILPEHSGFGSRSGRTNRCQNYNTLSPKKLCIFFCVYTGIHTCIPREGSAMQTVKEVNSSLLLEKSTVLRQCRVIITHWWCYKCHKCVILAFEICHL